MSGSVCGESLSRAVGLSLGVLGFIVDETSSGGGGGGRVFLRKVKFGTVFFAIFIAKIFFPPNYAHQHD